MADNGKKEVGVSDLANAVKVIDVACERGAFKGAEMYSIGALRQNLVNAIEAQEEPKEDTKELLQEDGKNVEESSKGK